MKELIQNFGFNIENVYVGANLKVFVSIQKGLQNL